jgi:hypothetical protein
VDQKSAVAIMLRLTGGATYMASALKFLANHARPIRRETAERDARQRRHLLDEVDRIDRMLRQEGLDVLYGQKRLTQKMAQSPSRLCGRPAGRRKA